MAEHLPSRSFQPAGSRQVQLAHQLPSFDHALIVGRDPKLAKILQLAHRIAHTDVPVIIQGESGTGKELIARAIYANSKRCKKAFVPINCGAFADTLLDSELFGHVRGAFTGAISDRTGWLSCANEGTIFLDEIAAMSPLLQVKLLRTLQFGEYSRVGETRARSCDVRFLAATNVDLEQRVRTGEFRADLYHRLNVISMTLPPLRDRRADIPLLARYFLEMFGRRYGKREIRLSQDAEADLLAYDFPGNVRELENVIERAVVLVDNGVVEPVHLPARIYETKGPGSKGGGRSGLTEAKKKVVEDFERRYISDCLTCSEGNISHAARIARIDVKNFYVKMRKYGIDPHHYKVTR